MSIRSITVLGCGALGLYYGTKIAKSGFNVKFLLRSDYDVIKKNGVRVTSINGDYNIKINGYKDPLQCGCSDLILICLKTTAKDYLLETLPHLISPSSYVMTLQNGLGNEELIAKIQEKTKIIGGVSFICSNRTEPGVVHHSAYGHIKANGYNMDFDIMALNEIKNIFLNAGINFIITDSLEHLKWEKLIWNVPFNGLSASLGGVDTEKLLNHLPLRKIIEKLMEEVLNAAKTDNIILDEDLIKENIDKTLTMGPYFTSMAIDRLNNRLVEVESIIGEPLRKANAKGINLPYMESLYAELSFYNTNRLEVSG